MLVFIGGFVWGVLQVVGWFCFLICAGFGGCMVADLVSWLFLVVMLCCYGLVVCYCGLV